MSLYGLPHRNDGRPGQILRDFAADEAGGDRRSVVMKNAHQLGGIDRMTGSFAASWNGTSLQFRFPVIRLEGNTGQVWTGSGSAQGTDGEVTLTPAGGRQVTLAGSLSDAGKDWVEH